MSGVGVSHVGFHDQVPLMQSKNPADVIAAKIQQEGILSRKFFDVIYTRFYGGKIQMNIQKNSSFTLVDLKDALEKILKNKYSIESLSDQNEQYPHPGPSSIYYVIIKRK